VTGPEQLLSASPDDTERAGAAVADRLRPGDIVLLEGDLAAGKTTFVRGLVGRLGGPANDVSSPTFVLLQTYPCDRRGVVRLHHVDLYRLADQLADLREIGLEDVFADAAAVTAVEWPKDALASWMPTVSRLWKVRIEILDDDQRRIAITSP
jgi:tRNA threonylcarbamoyladenosine biosynthesis protein TsaE